VEKTLAWLDDYEEFGPEHPQPNEYVRNNVQVEMMEMMENGNGNGNGNGVEGNPTTTVPIPMPTMLTAICYVWNRPVKDAQGKLVHPIIAPIQNGDWMAECSAMAKDQKWMGS
jgi:hypothetical protein